MATNASRGKCEAAPAATSAKRWRFGPMGVSSNAISTCQPRPSGIFEQNVLESPDAHRTFCATNRLLVPRLKTGWVPAPALETLNVESPRPR